LERLILRAFLVFGIVCMPFKFSKGPVKDWAIVFFSTAYFATFVANILIKGNKLKHPVRLLPHYFQTNVLYELLILPLYCVVFNQSTEGSKPTGVIRKALLFSGTHTCIEYVLEKKTDLVVWKKWTWFHNVSSLSLMLLGSKGVLSFYKWLSKKVDK
jgi:hypothetical protein